MSEPRSLTAVVVGAGPAGLMAAETLAAEGFQVTVFDRMPTPARKLLIAGRGGLNLTHSEPLPNFLGRFRGSLADAIREAVRSFPPAALRAWCEGLGEETFVGTSGRVFPRAMKASPLLRAWLKRLERQGVALKSRHRWMGFGDAGQVLFETTGGPISVGRPDVVVLALGGASWPHLGSDAAWVDILKSDGAAVAPLMPQNSGFDVAWSDVMRERYAGAPLKRIAITFEGETRRGEVVITERGLEGGAIYALSGYLRDAILARGQVQVTINLKPEMTGEALTRALAAPRGKASLATVLRKSLHLSPQAIGVLQEAAHAEGISLAKLAAPELAERITHVPLTLTGVAPIARAISSAGGVMQEAIDPAFMLKARPGVFVAGEMLDWEAPTGGYLLQASFATGFAAASAAAQWAKAASPHAHSAPLA